MIVAGLTGSIASGKSSVASVFRSAGAVVIDADQLAKDAVRKGTPAWQAIIGHFGRKILLPSGELDRKQLGDIIFTHPELRNRLNAIVHPHVRAETEKRLQKIEQTDPHAVVILDVPLLFETGMDRGLDEIIVVYLAESLQLQRLMARDHLSEEAAKARIASQMSIEEKKKRATIIIDNSADPSATRQQTLAVFDMLKARARAK